MKKLLFLTCLIVVLAIIPKAYAVNNFETERTASAGVREIASESGNHKIFPTPQTALSKLDDLKARGDLEITRRIETLNKLIIKINAFKRLSSVQKSDLTSQVQTQIDSLTVLKTKIDADSDTATLRTDVKSIITDYRIYVFFIQDINLIAAAERMGTAIDNMTILSGKLQTRITDAQGKGSDVTELNTKYADMLTQLSNAKVLVDEVNSKLSGLTAADYPANKTSLDDSRVKLRTAFTDLKNSYEDAFSIIRLLKQIKLFPTLTPTITPIPKV